MCANCGAPLMLIVVPPATRKESVWTDVFPPEHLLERISHLELRFSQVTDRLSQTLDLMVRQAEALQREQLLVQTLIEALTAAGVIAGGEVNREWLEKQKVEEQKTLETARLEKTLNQILNESNGTRLDLFVNLVKDGFILLNRIDEKQGLRTLERAAALEPNNFALHAFVGTRYFLIDKHTLAQDYLKIANRISQTDKKVNLLLGVIAADAGELETAKNLLEPLGANNGFAINFVLGLIYAKENRLSETLAVFKRALQSTQTAETYYLVGSICAELKREKTAIKHLRKAVELDQNFTDAWFMLAIVYLRTNNEKAAKEAIAQSLAARDLGARAANLLRNPKKYQEIADTTLLFSRLAHVDKNLISNSSPRLAKMLREEIERKLIIEN